jgi:hypothetical protein
MADTSGSALSDYTMDVQRNGSRARCATTECFRTLDLFHGGCGCSLKSAGTTTVPVSNLKLQEFSTPADRQYGLVRPWPVFPLSWFFESSISSASVKKVSDKYIIFLLLFLRYQVYLQDINPNLGQLPGKSPMAEE